MPGDQIPTEKELADFYNVSTITARQAILNLVQEGLLRREQGKGTFVQSVDRLANVKNIMTLNVSGDLKNTIPENIMSQKVRVLDMMKVRSSRVIADTLNISEGQEVFQVRRTRGDNNMVFSYIKNYLPVHLGEQVNKEDLLKYPMLYILRHKLGIPLSKGVQYIGAVIDYETAATLSVSISSPLLYLETSIYDIEDKPVEFVQTFYRSDKFKYTITHNLNEISCLL